MTLTFSEELDGPCQECGERHPKTLCPQCHPDAALKVSYFEGVLSAFCAECNRPVARIAVGRRLLAGISVGSSAV